jgi:hypothetical protein
MRSNAPRIEARAGTTTTYLVSPRRRFIMLIRVSEKKFKHVCGGLFGQSVLVKNLTNQAFEGISSV